MVLKLCGSVGVVLGATLALSACGSQMPQACRELKPAVDSYRSVSEAYRADGGDRFFAGALVAALDELARTARAVSDTGSAREEGIAEDLRQFSIAIQRFDEEGAAALAGITAVNIEEVCGYEIFGD